MYIEDNLKASEKNIYLKRAEVMTVKYTSSKQEKSIKNIRVDYNPIVSNVIVKCDGEVFKVAINGKEAHYEGDYTYSLGIAALGRSEKIDIKVYDDKDILLEVKTYEF